jgi:hypothetical protein
MQAFSSPTGKRLLRTRNPTSSTNSLCIFHAFKRRIYITKWRSALSALPSSASTLAERHYTAPSLITTRTEFEQQYRHHMATPNRYCRYGDIELFAPSEDGAATILRAVAEPMVRAHRWLRVGDCLSHIILYELLKVFAALVNDRELILAGSDELDALAHLAHHRVQTASTSTPLSRRAATEGHIRGEQGHRLRQNALAG